MRGAIRPRLTPPSELVLLALVTLSTSCWLALWIGLISQATVFAGRRPLLHGPTVFGLMLVTGLAAHLALSGGRPLSQARAIVLVVAALAVGFALLAEYAGPVQWQNSFDTPLLVSTLMAGALAWAGVRLGRGPLQFDGVREGFLLGLFALLALLVIVAAAGLMQSFTAGAALAILLFFAASLISLSLARMLEVQTQAQAAHGQQLRPGGRWLAFLGSLVAALLLLGLFLSSLVSLSVLRLLLAPVVAALGWLANVLLYLLLPLILLGAGLVYVLRLLISLAGVANRPQPPQPDDVSRTLQNLQHQSQPGIPPEIVLLLKALLIGAALLAVAIVLVRSLFRRPPEQGNGIAEELHESVFDRAQFWASLRAFLRSALGRLARWRPHPGTAGPAPTRSAAGLEHSPPSVRTVREIYRLLLARMAQRGQARRPAETPYTYLEALSSGLQQGRSELSAITDAYVRARYGERPASEAELDQVREAWAALDARLTEAGNPET